jgi:hypothetical protein
MISLASWNIRGLNHPLKQKEVRSFVRDNQLSLCAVLESHVDVDNLFKICGVVFRSWNWTSNNSMCLKGTRIIIGWDPSVMDVMVLFQSDQVMHLQIIIKADNRVLFVSILYAANYYMTRKSYGRI